MAALSLPSFSRHATGSLIVALALAGCPGGPPVGPPKPTPRATGKPAEPAAKAVPADALAKAVAGASTRAIAGGVATRLTGKVKLLAAITGAEGGRIISNNGGTIISDNGAGVVANNGAGYRVQQAARPAELPLAEAVVTVHDAAGALLTGPDGQPIAAYTDRQGGYVLAAALPDENVVLKVRLWNGGELQAMRPRDAGADQPLDTATSLGAAYVLATYVKGDQRVFDKLPAAEALALRAAIAAAPPADVPTYEPADLITRTDGLRARVAAVDARLDAIAALLIGQASIGDGRLATEVAIPRPAAMAVDARGHLFLGDARLGRVREIDAAGRITTFGDLLLGTRVKRNVLDLTVLAPTPGGGFWIGGDSQLFAADADGELVPQTATGPYQPSPIAMPTAELHLHPRQVAFAADGTAYVWDAAGDVAGGRPDRILALRPDGRATDVPLDAALVGRSLYGVGVDAAGDLYTLSPLATGTGRLLRRTPDGAWSVHASWPIPTPEAMPRLAVAPDGTAYVSEPDGNRVMRVSPAGQLAVAAGAGGPAATGGLDRPGVVALAPDGTLYVADGGSGRVFALRPDGSFRPAAGASGVVTRTGDLTAIALNTPHGVAAEGDGRFVFTESAGFALKRFDGRAVETVAGQARGFGGDGGPAVQARLDAPSGVARHGDATWVLDAGNNALRRIGPDGRITTVAGRALAPGGATGFPAPGSRAAAGSIDLYDAQGLAIDPQGRPHWSHALNGRIMRLDADGMVAHVAGRGTTQPTLAADLAGAIGDAAASWPAAEAPLVGPLGLAFDARGDLYVAEPATLRVLRVSGLAGGSPTVHRHAGAPVAEVLARLGASFDMAAELRRPPLEATLAAPVALAFDAAGALYVSLAGSRPIDALPADLTGSVASALPQVGPAVVRLGVDGRFRIVAGAGGAYFADPLAEDALTLPGGLAVDAQGRLAICDTGANLLRILPPAATAP